MFIDEKELFKQADAERKAQKDYEMSCARTFSFEFEAPSINVRRTVNIVAMNEEAATALLYRQLPTEWVRAGLNITGFESRQRVDLIDPHVITEYQKRMVPAQVKPKRK